MQNKLILVYLLVFLSAIILLRMIGIIHIANGELFGYALIIYGLSLFYTSFIERKKTLLFLGSVLFLSGLLLFLLENFEFANINQLLLPSAAFILSISSFMVYISDTVKKLPLYISVILLAAAIGITALMSDQGLPGFFNNIVSVASKYWTILVILTIVIILVSKDTKGKDK